MKNLVVVDHPLVQDKLARLRDRDTPVETFRRLMGEIAPLLAFEATRDLVVKSVRVRTPLEVARGAALRYEVLIVPILRAGLGLLPGLLEVVPSARVGFLGLKRDEETLLPDTYHRSLPAKLGRCEVILVDPMLATGGSLLAALKVVMPRRPKSIRILSLLASPAGVRAVHREYPAVRIITAALDRSLDHRGYICPGLGDAGDRTFGV